ncbi:alpha-1,2-mannosyltransferase [Actinopolyspora mzabensis]|uniref:Alpha-1,2-mannosyltransferase n=1 Tax=Actinopolyspora mzabensis TaxID=995066 RepID=A0A1G8XE66_ACTMZ|nr:glycosyltransferase 87 family protein [Actinopolyspora mzabensis]SDJ88858.1 alpha-1,2-mannosyltransferase [Actinopolyspora mzabensis]
MPAVVAVALTAFAAPTLLQWMLIGTPVLGDFLDVTVYRAGGAALLNGEPLYESDLPALTGSYPFTYPPFAAIIFTPLSFVPTWLCRALVIPAHMLLLVTVVRELLRHANAASIRERRRATVAVVALVFLVEPLTWTMWLGQINLLLLALVLLDLVGEHRSSGVAVGIATGIKLTPGLFIVYLMCTRRFGMAARAAGATAATIGLGFLVAPHDSLRYWSGVFADNSRFGATAGQGNLSINGAVARMLGDGDLRVLLWLVLAGIAVVAGLAVATAVHNRGEVLLGLTLCGLTTTAVSPFSWSHHWVWLGPLTILALLYAPKSVCAVLGVLTFAWPVHIILGLESHFPVLGISTFPPWHGFEMVYGNAYLITFVGTLIFVSAGWFLRTEPGRQLPRTSSRSR